MCGGVLIGVGIWAMVERSKYYQTDIKDVYDVFTDVSIVLIVFGIIIFIIACAGCIGALRENVILLKIVSRGNYIYCHNFCKNDTCFQVSVLYKCFIISFTL